MSLGEATADSCCLIAVAPCGASFGSFRSITPSGRMGLHAAAAPQLWT